ncbi:MAG: hypothetical protein HYY06_00215 [Deltaproteobacteria bacterium]|nr:hypothetical protein [Deltaproteobacteria bacterium]
MWIYERPEAEAGRSFAGRAVAPALPDGESGKAGGRGADVLGEAERAGFVEAGDLALWGAGIDTEGSVAILFEVGRVCAGWGMALHSLALARRLSRELGGGDVAIAASPIAPRCPPLEVLERPDPSWIEPRLEGDRATGIFPHAWGFPRPDASGSDDVLAFVRGDGWALVRARAAVTRDDGRRLGLRACDLFRVELAGRAEVAASGERARQLLEEHVARLWLGMAALAAGCAAGAVREAARYAAERFQGGSAIEKHAAVSMLLGEARARADSAVAALGAARQTLVASARVRLTATADAACAVTRSLQVLGGAGYMEDFPLCKRLRDVEVLRISQGTPDDLRRILAADLARCA